MSDDAPSGDLPEATSSSSRGSAPAAAAWYARHGWPVFPVWGVDGGRCACGKAGCERTGKHPIGAVAPNGFKDASTDVETVTAWWTQYPTANIGIATGAGAGIWVLDVDGEVGIASLDRLLEQRGPLPETVTATTGGGGRHFLFAYAEGVGSRVRFAEGLDTRGDGGYIVAAPSRHASGRVYEWQPGRKPNEISVAAAPEWLLDLVCIPVSKPAAAPGDHAPEAGGAPDSPIGEGGRNAFLTSQGGRLRHAGLSEAAILAALLEVNRERCRPPLGGAEVATIARSVARYAPGSASAAWEPPIPFAETTLPTFPVEVLPPWLRAWVEAVSVATQTPLDVAGLLSLAIIALASAKKLEVKVRERWSEPLNLYVVIALRPGEGKSPVFKMVTGPVHTFEKAERKRLDPIIEQAQIALDIAKKRLESAERRAGKAKPEEREAIEAEITAARETMRQIKIPAVPRIIADDITAESLVNLLRDQGGRLGIFSAEAGPFEMMAGRYSDTGPNFEVYLKAHSGDYLAVDRISRTGGFVSSPALTLGLTVQPSVIAGLAKNDGFRGRGLLARFLYAIPKSWAGSRDADPAEVPMDVWIDYARAVDEMLRLPTRLDADGEFDPREIRLSSDAYGEIVNFKAEIEPRLGADGDLRPLADWMSKAAGAAIRLAGLLHVADLAGRKLALDDFLNEISAEAVRRAITLVRYLIAHASAAFDLMATDEDAEIAKYVLGAILRKGEARVSQREIHRAVRSRVKNVADLQVILDVLEGRGFIRLDQAPNEGKRGRPSRLYEVNPLAVAPHESWTERTDTAPGGTSVHSVHDPEASTPDSGDGDDNVEVVL